MQVELGRLEGDIALASERLANAGSRRLRAPRTNEALMESRAAQEADARGTAAARPAPPARAEHERIRGELAERAPARRKPAAGGLRQRERMCGPTGAGIARPGFSAFARSKASARRSRGSSARCVSEPPRRTRTARRCRRELARPPSGGAPLVERAGFRLLRGPPQQPTTPSRARHHVAETREHEATERADAPPRRRDPRSADRAAAALEELERDRVGLAPAAAALLAARERFGDTILGPLSDFVSTSRADAELAERLLGEWMHAVLVRDEATADAVRAWHAEHQPGALVLLPLEPGPVVHANGQPLDERLQVAAPAAAWVQAALAGSRRTR